MRTFKIKKKKKNFKLQCRLSFVQDQASYASLIEREASKSKLYGALHSHVSGCGTRYSSHATGWSHHVNDLGQKTTVDWSDEPLKYVENILWRRLLFNHPFNLTHGQPIEWTDWTSKTHMQDGSHMMVGLDLTFVPHHTCWYKSTGWTQAPTQA